jgi:hypothetical protein
VGISVECISTQRVADFQGNIRQGALALPRPPIFSAALSAATALARSGSTHLLSFAMLAKLLGISADYGADPSPTADALDVYSVPWSP